MTCRRVSLKFEEIKYTHTHKRNHRKQFLERVKNKWIKKIKLVICCKWMQIETNITKWGWGFLRASNKNPKEIHVWVLINLFVSCWQLRMRSQEKAPRICLIVQSLLLQMFSKMRFHFWKTKQAFQKQNVCRLSTTGPDEGIDKAPSEGGMDGRMHEGTTGGEDPNMKV